MMHEHDFPPAIDLARVAEDLKAMQSSAQDASIKLDQANSLAESFIRFTDGMETHGRAIPKEWGDWLIAELAELSVLIYLQMELLKAIRPAIEAAEEAPNLLRSSMPS